MFTPATCYNCSGDLNLTTIATCFCNHILDQGIGLFYDPPEIIEPLVTSSLPFFADRYVNIEWTSSMGFRISLVAGVIYILGLGISIVIDINPRKRILIRLLKDLRDIDRYGYKQEESDSEEGPEEVKTNY